MSEFLNMGGYALYVWPCFALTALVMLANLASALYRRKKVIAQLRDSADSSGLTESTDNAS